jgi:hypothetical protein
MTNRMFISTNLRLLRAEVSRMDRVIRGQNRDIRSRDAHVIKLVSENHAQWKTFEQVFSGIKSHVGTYKVLKDYTYRLLSAVRKKNDMELLRRLVGPSKNVSVTGYCKNCMINLYGEKKKPHKDTLPCPIRGCKYG